MQKHVNLVDLVKSFPTNIYLQNLASIQKRTSPKKFAHLAEKSQNGSISNLSTKVWARLVRGGSSVVVLNNKSRRTRLAYRGKELIPTILLKLIAGLMHQGASMSFRRASGG